MAGSLKYYKIFIASPGGLIEERNKFRETIEEFNRIDAINRGFYFQPVGWEDTLGQFGRPQEIINMDLKTCDFMFIVLHDRWGSPTSLDSKYSSGTEEEFHLGLECLNDDNMPMLRIALFFKDVPKNQLADPGTQLSRVLSFKKEREEKKDFLYETFDIKENFIQKLKYHLAQILRDLESNNLKNLKNKVNDEVDTSFLGSNFEWLTNIMKYNNWDQAYDEAQKLLKQGKNIEAELIFSQITQRSNNPYLIARYGKYLRKQGRIGGALEAINRAIDLSIALKDKATEAYCVRQFGRIEEYKGNLNEALELFNDSKEMYEEINDNTGIARVLRDIAFAENKLGRPDKAIRDINESIQIYEDENDMGEKAASLGYLGVIYKDLGRFSESEKTHNEALVILKKMNNTEGLARVYSNIAVIHRLRKNYYEAIEQHEKSLEIFEKINDKRDIAREYGNIGVILRRLENNSEAINKHYAALEIEEKIGNERGMQIQFSNIGLNYLDMDKLDKAEYYFNKSLEISKRIDDLKGESHQYKNFCSLHLKKKDLDNAKLVINKAFKIDETLKNLFGIASCNRLLASIYLEEGNQNIGIEYLTKSREIYFQMELNEYVDEIDIEIQTLNRSPLDGQSS